MIQIPHVPTPPQPPLPPGVIIAGGGPPEAVLIASVLIVGIVVAGIVLYPLLRAFARRIEARSGRPELEGEVEQLRTRVAELEQVHHRLAELEERVDFSERLLSQGRGDVPVDRSAR